MHLSNAVISTFFDCYYFLWPHVSSYISETVFASRVGERNRLSGDE